jgi:hypothetical protein
MYVGILTLIISLMILAVGLLLPEKMALATTNSKFSVKKSTKKFSKKAKSIK